MENQSQQPIRLIRLPEVLSMVSVSKSTWFNWIATGKAPRSYRIGEKISVWKSSDIENFIEEVSHNE